MITQRFNPNRDWFSSKMNPQFIGICHLIHDICKKFDGEESVYKMIEIGAYMGESTFLFGCSGLFDEIHTIDPHHGEEEFNELFGYDWDLIKKEYEINTRNFPNIIHWSEFSFELNHKFADNDFDFIYIDGDHTYEGVSRDLDLFLPKIKKGGIVAGHDYTNNWEGVRRAVDEAFGSPSKTYADGSWLVNYE